jgi:hypothetical protein
MLEFILLIVCTKPHTLHGCEYVLSDTIIRQNTYANWDIPVWRVPLFLHEYQVSVINTCYTDKKCLVIAYA